MKKKDLLTLLLLTLAFAGCQFNQSVNKDLATGAYSRGDGISSDDVKMEINGEADSRNEFVYGEKVKFIFNDITGLNKEDGKVFPGLSMFIIKNETDTILEHQDLLADMNEGTDLTPLQLQANFIAALPFQNNEAYKVYVNIWDKKGEGTYHYELPFSVKPYDFLAINAAGISYTNIYLWDETKQMVVFKKEISADNTFILILEGLDGLEVTDGKVYPAFSIDITDAQGNQILSDPNILEQYRSEGVDHTAFKEGQLPVTITFSPGEIFNPCQLKASLTDLNSDRSIDISCTLEIK